jgi:hypothetical protein
MTRLCKICGKEFEVERVPSGKYSRRMFCSKECEMKASEQTRIKHICPICNKEFVYERLPNGEYNKRKYCSSECRDKATHLQCGFSVCKKCGKTFERTRTTTGAYTERLYCDECIESFKYDTCAICGEKYLKTTEYTGKYCEKCRKDQEYECYHKTCLQCGKDFKLHRLPSGKLSGQVLCDSCAKLNYHKAHFGICKVCGKEFEYSTDSKGYVIKTSYCSDECYEKYRPQRKQGWLEKITKTNLEKYGVPFSCLLPECQEKQGIIISKVNLAFADLLKENNIYYEQEFTLGNGLYSYDFYVKSENTEYLIEINPTFTHTCVNTGVYSPRDINYHINKTEYAIDRGFNCIHVWQWDDWNKIVSIIKPKQRLYARKLKLKDVPKREANIFLNMHHLQNSCYGNSVNLGLYQNDELVELITFGEPRYNKNYEWELLRLCTHSDYIVIGGAEKLFKYFKLNYEPNSIISYCDISKFIGNVYKRLGFILKEQTKPQKIWSDKKEKYITDNLLRQFGFDRLIGSKLNPPEIYGKGTDNEMLMLNHKWLPIYDCGQKVFEYRIKELINNEYCTIQSI